MRRRTRESRPAEWAIHSAFVPRRDGPRRLEQAFQLLLGADAGSDDMPSLTEGRIDHESCRLCQGLDRETGA
jgi:hypothetical protein